MFHLSAMKGLFNDSITQMMAMPTNKLTLRNNQVVQGKVLKLFPDQKALIQVGQSKLVAQLEASINPSERYWFRVKGSEQSLQLKIMKQVEGDHFTNHSVSKDLLLMFQQKTSKENILLASELAKDHIPFTKQQLITAIEILKNTPKKDSMIIIDAVKYAMKHEFPLTENVIKSLVQTQSAVPLAKQIDTLLHSIQSLEQPQGLFKQLQQTIQNLKQLSENLLSKGTFDLSLENGLKIKETSLEIQTLREILGSLRNEGLAGSIVEDQIDSLFQRLSGQTLLQHDIGPTSQMITQVPLFALNNTDLTIQWSGQKQGNGNIDPAFCRILFYLQLPILTDTMVDVQIQNRVMKIIITNNLEALKPLVSQHTDKLKELLNEMDYHLSSIKVVSFDPTAKQNRSKTQLNINSRTESYMGIDVKV